MRFSADHVEQWHTDGFVIIPHFFEKHEYEPVLADYEVLYGSLATLSTYAISGSYCGLGVGGTSSWAGVPGGNIWFVVVGTSGAGTEASWGFGTAGQRGGATASGQCGNTVRDNGTTCP